MTSKKRLALIAALAALAVGADAAPVTVPNTFTAGSPARAADVNANFGALATGLNAHDGRIGLLETGVAAHDGRIGTLEAGQVAQAGRISALETGSTSHDARLAALEAAVASLQGALTAAQGRITDLEAKVASVSTVSVNGQPTVRFSGVNVQVVNGLGSTATANGTGNLIVGYDEPDPSGIFHCTIGTSPTSGASSVDPTSCTAAGGAWTNTGFKTGSHYLVGGSGNNYSRWGGAILGLWNTANYDYAGVTGGSSNTAGGTCASVTGGNQNYAWGNTSAVQGGQTNSAVGLLSSVSGGKNGQAVGVRSSVAGGFGNIASGDFSSVVGGDANTSTGVYSSVLGGLGQNATAANQTIPALP